MFIPAFLELIFQLVIENVFVNIHEMDSKEDKDGFKRIPGFPNYRINRQGQVQNVTTKIFLQPTNDRVYPVVDLFGGEGDKTRSSRGAHLWVAELFVKNPSPESKIYVNHKDLDKSNYNFENLEWVTRSENMIHARESGPYETKTRAVNKIDEKGGIIKTFKSVTEAAQEAGLTSSSFGYRMGQPLHMYKYAEPSFAEQSEAIDLKDEIWKSIEKKGFEHYHVSNLGRVKNSTKNMLISPTPLDGYVRAQLNVDGKNHSFAIHRLVATAFCVKSEGKDVVNHIDENTLNNHATNLEWLTGSGNITHSLGRPVVKLDAETNEFLELYPSITQAAAAIDVGDSGIFLSIKDPERSSGGFKWRYATEQEAGKKIRVQVKRIQKEAKQIKIRQLHPKTRKLIKVWDSIKEAAQTMKTSPNTIRKAMYHKDEVAAKFKWAFDDPARKTTWEPYKQKSKRKFVPDSFSSDEDEPATKKSKTTLNFQPQPKTA